MYSLPLTLPSCWAYYVLLLDPNKFYLDQYPSTGTGAVRITQSPQFTPQAEVLVLLLGNVYLLLALLAGVCIWTPHRTIAKRVWGSAFWDVGVWNDMMWGNVGALLPLIVFTIGKSGLFDDEKNAGSDTATGSDKPSAGPVYTSATPLYVSTACGVAATYVSSGSNTTLSIGLAYATLTALALRLAQSANLGSQNASNGRTVYSTNGFLAQPEHTWTDTANTTFTMLRDVSAAATMGTGVASLIIEGLSTGGLSYWGVLGSATIGMGVFGQVLLGAVYGAAMVLLHVAMYASLLLLVQQHDALTSSFGPLYAAICSQLIVNLSTSRIWFATVCAASTFVFLGDTGASTSMSHTKPRMVRLLVLIAAISFVALAILSWRQPLHIPRFTTGPSGTAAPLLDTSLSAAPDEEYGPLRYSNSHVHPVDQLVRDAEASFMSTLQRQSQTLEAAVVEYKRRYALPPPPNFDKWFDFAKRKGVQLIDEYDTIYHSLLPFWALPPATIRARVREALGFGGNNLMGVLIRNGKAVHVEAGPEWMQAAVVGMMEQFVEFLPDVDLAFNVHDEPRVVVPHDELSRLVRIAVNQSLPAALAHAAPRNAFSPRPDDVKNSKRIAEVKTTRFNVFAHQPTWIPSRMSCSSDSPARSLDDNTSDNLTAYALDDLGFVYNHTAFSDICNSPSFGSSHGFFDRPNAFNVIHELFPIFSQSKMSSFQDILYPSPWYWYGKVSYDSKQDYDWKAKINSLWWRGSTTGGFSRDGGWRRQHRQKMVGKLNALDQAMVLGDVKKTPEDLPEWTTKSVSRQEYKDIIDVHFSHVGQCDPGDCDAQREFFDVKPPVDQQDAWKYRFLLDVDGNAFSGRFYAFLKSHSLTFKMAVFREWHEEWIMPWVHYIPLSLKGEEVLETVRYLSAESEGKSQAIRMAEGSREWAGKVLRNEDFEVWFFRLLLEYGRIVDDNRETIGFAGS
ncbi:hypothetical protein LTR78_005347 [Recurvomyces mirabilis]|uniref:Glycosyl transferase CAP10 domain-containing protein n=2 Tax=Recurvomyces mirabilis TaxID=574656 RepID=A0AAE0WMW5_9PEZI|nr:hypothetical protein LTR78_005347 [Recurvomyces mirabilis]